jgi:hypothetical protein
MIAASGTTQDMRAAFRWILTYPPCGMRFEPRDTAGAAGGRAGGQRRTHRERQLDDAEDQGGEANGHHPAAGACARAHATIAQRRLTSRALARTVQRVRQRPVEEIDADLRCGRALRTGGARRGGDERTCHWCDVQNHKVHGSGVLIESMTLTVPSGRGTSCGGNRGRRGQFRTRTGRARASLTQGMAFGATAGTASAAGGGGVSTAGAEGGTAAAAVRSGATASERGALSRGLLLGTAGDDSLGSEPAAQRTPLQRDCALLYRCEPGRGERGSSHRGAGRQETATQHCTSDEDLQPEHP